ncbi:MAG: hypothetical protein IKB02_09840 [Clostridia bacterium]|nr:hypothetical protein [Clostridia bacterium]MBR2389034.1 hypothetical protein [Clostridia bacterium]
MRVSQLLHVMDKNDEVVINDFGKAVDKMTIYEGLVKGINRDNPINKMCVACICASDDTIYIVAEFPKGKGGE